MDSIDLPLYLRKDFLFTSNLPFVLNIFGSGPSLLSIKNLDSLNLWTKFLLNIFNVIKYNYLFTALIHPTVRDYGIPLWVTIYKNMAGTKKPKIMHSHSYQYTCITLWHAVNAEIQSFVDWAHQNSNIRGDPIHPTMRDTSVGYLVKNMASAQKTILSNSIQY